MLAKMALFCSIVPAFAQNAALVASLSGRAETGKSKPVLTLDWLADGAVIHVGAESKAVIILLNGHRFELGAHARATIGPAKLGNTSGPVRELDPLPPIPKAAPLNIQSDAAAVSRFRGTGMLKEMCPRAGMAALPESAKVSFHPVEGASVYEIVLENADGETVAERQTRATEIEVPLDPASHYFWRVRALGPAGVIAEDQAAFVTLSKEEAGARKAFAAAIGADPALAGEVDFESGLICEAMEEFSAALGKHPMDPAAKRGLERARSALLVK